MAKNVPSAAPTVQPASLDKWTKLKLFVAKRHDYYESEYRATNFASDEAQMAFYRSIFQTMKDLDEAELSAGGKK